MSSDDQMAPQYIALTYDGSEGHIVVGITPETLCSRNDITSTVQVPEDKSPLEFGNHKLCEDCLEAWDTVKDTFEPEPVVYCHECNRPYSVQRARDIENRESGVEQVCKSCYVKLYENDESGVTLPYEEVEPHWDLGVDRHYKQEQSSAELKID